MEDSEMTTLNIPRPFFCTVALPGPREPETAQFLGWSVVRPDFGQIWFDDSDAPQFVHRSRISDIREQ